MHAESGEHVEFKLLTTWREYFLARAQRRSLKIVIKSLRRARTKLLNTYCKEVREGRPHYTKLLVCNVLDNTVAFYTEDLITIEEMLREFELFLFSGNFLDFVILGIRRDSEYWDHRRK